MYFITLVTLAILAFAAYMMLARKKHGSFVTALPGISDRGISGTPAPRHVFKTSKGWRVYTTNASGYPRL